MEGSQHDCYVESVIIWSGRVGVRSVNGANQISGVHPWNLRAPDGGIGIELVNGRGRVYDCYLDFTPLVIVDPSCVQVTSSFFLAQARLVLQSDKTTLVQNLVVTDNLWSPESYMDNDTIVITGSKPFTDVEVRCWLL